jgi:hypothetical protein
MLVSYANRFEPHGLSPCPCRGTKGDEASLSAVLCFQCLTRGFQRCANGELDRKVSGLGGKRAAWSLIKLAAAASKYLHGWGSGCVLAYDPSMWLLKRVHAYAGLLTFVNLAVYGVVGLSVTFLRESQPSAPVVSYQNFSLEPNLTDRQLAQRVRSRLNLSLATPLNNAAIEYDAANHLRLAFHDVNGSHRVTVLENQGRLRVETIHNSFGIYLDALHGRTASFHASDWRMQLWADYNEFAMWCLLAACV